MIAQALPHIVLRKAVAGDVDAIVAIEQEQFTNPWKRTSFTSELNHDIAFFYVALDGDTGNIAGYILFWVIGDTIELHNIAVSSLYKKRGVGKKMMLFMLEKAKQKKSSEIFLEVRASNTEAIQFYHAFNFQVVSTRKNYYALPTEDAVIYRLVLS